MLDRHSRPAQARGLVVALLLLLIGGGAAGFVYYQRNRPGNTKPPIIDAPTENIESQVHHFCGGCHAYPPAHTFPKRDWNHEVTRGYEFFEQGHIHFSQAKDKNLRPPPIDDVIKYYVERAPAELPLIDAKPAGHPVPVKFEPISFAGPAAKEPFAISHLNVVRLFDAKRPDILACDMRNGLVMALQPYLEKPSWKILGQVANPAHAEVVDLDGDGVRDVIVACLGSFTPTDTRCGSVVWLRGRPDGSFAPHTLLADVGRVADVQAADFRGVGKLDLVVASFGWNRIGDIVYLQNDTTDWSKPKFTPRSLDNRHGAIHVPVVDLNSDGKPDFVTVFAQENESVVAFINDRKDGMVGFRKETIYDAPHPGYGSSGIQMVDMNGDGRLDVLYSNGDTLDTPFLLKPYHGVQWLENPADGKFPWKHHPIAPMYGVHRALAGDFSGSSKIDVIAASFLPPEAFPQRQKLNLDALLLLERTGPATFARHPLQSISCDYATCAAGDIYGSSRPDIVTGYFAGTRQENVVTVWKNLGRAKQ